MKKRILIYGITVAIAYLLMILPSVSAIEHNTVRDMNKSEIFEEIKEKIKNISFLMDSLMFLWKRISMVREKKKRAISCRFNIGMSFIKVWKDIKKKADKKARNFLVYLLKNKKTAKGENEKII